jgi:hypothetical protein
MADQLTLATDQLITQLRDIEDPHIREATCRVMVTLCRQVRAEAIQELYRSLGTWEKVGEAVGLPRQDAWRIARG